MHEFLRQNYYNQIMQLGSEDKPALIVDFQHLDRFNPVIADELLERPRDVLADFDKAIEAFGLGFNMPVRIRNLPERRIIRVRNFRAEHIGKLISTDIIVKSATEVKPQISKAYWRCQECENEICLIQDEFLMQKISKCDGCGRRGDFGEPTRTEMIDTRMLKGVEPFEVTSGEQPSEMAIFLKEDLTTPQLQKKTDPGSRIRVVGWLKELPTRIKGKLSTKLDTYIEANHVETSEIEFEDMEISPENEAEIQSLARDPKVFEKLWKSIAPGIFGHADVKEAIALQLFGGAVHKLPDGSRIRGNIHILLTGDPSVGKTVLLKIGSTIVPRGKYVSGSGVSGVGLTASVRKDEVFGTWVLEAGALVLANKGLIGIDEFDKMSQDDQIAMHEAMSVETISIAKASIVATLPAQTAVLAGANPKLGRFDPYKSIIEQIQIPETLMSRFDLKFVMRDLPDKARDEQLAEHVLSGRLTPKTVEPAIPVNLLRKYIAYAKKITDIRLSKEAADVMKNFYVEMRGSGGEGVSITLRQYEALLRLAEASARVRLDRAVSMEDAERAIKLMKTSLMQLGYDHESGRIDIDKFEGGVSATQRSKIRIVLDVIARLQKETGKEVPVQDVEAAAEEEGVTNAGDVIDKLKREGLVFEPRPGHIKKT